MTMRNAVPFCGRGVFLTESDERTITMENENKVAVISIIVESGKAVDELNALLHGYGEYIIGRMGIPYREKGINIISVAIDAPQDVISALSGKLGNLPGVMTKTAYSNVVTKLE